MGGPLSVTFANISLTKLEKLKVKPAKPKFYKRYVDDIITRRNTDTPDELFKIINSYHHKINFTVEQNPDKFLDTSMTVQDGNIITGVYRKPNKFPAHWSSAIPKRYKRNTINGDLTRSHRISMDFNKEITLIRDKYKTAGYPTKFTESVIRQFKQRLTSNENDDEDEMIIPQFLFEEPKKFKLIEIPFCGENERLVKRFLNKLNNFTHHSFSFAIKWSTKKVKQLFSTKDRNPHPVCKIYEGTCSCDMNYIGETKRNVETRWNEHNNPNRDSEPAKHIRAFPDHEFTWNVLMTAPINTRVRKNLEAFIIAIKKPSINDQLESNNLILFRNGVT